MTENHPELAATVARVYETITRLRAPDGCPWDRKQTPASLRSSVLEEAHEVVDAINSSVAEDVEEELGDLLLLVLMIARIYEERGEFTAGGVAERLNEKLIRRHPHVFGDSVANDADEVVIQWNRIKVELEGKPEKTGVLDGVSGSLPTLERAFALQKKASKAGFDWKEFSGVREKMHEEIDELCDLLESDAEANGPDRTKNRTSSEEIEGEIGDLLFSAVNLSRTHGVDPSLALGRTNAKFLERFRFVESKMSESSLPMSADHLSEMERFWEEAKRSET